MECPWGHVSWEQWTMGEGSGSNRRSSGLPNSIGGSWRLSEVTDGNREVDGRRRWRHGVDEVSGCLRHPLTVIRFCTTLNQQMTSRKKAENRKMWRYLGNFSWHISVLTIHWSSRIGLSYCNWYWADLLFTGFFKISLHYKHINDCV